MNELQPSVDTVSCDNCSHAVGSLWYQIQVEEWLYPDCRSKRGYVICETCFPQLAQLLWRRQANEDLSNWVEAQSTTD